MNPQNRFTLSYDEISLLDSHNVGPKNAYLGETLKSFKKKQINIPDGVVLTSFSYETFIDNSNSAALIKTKVPLLKMKDMAGMERTSLEIRQKIMNSEFPIALKDEIAKKYQELEKKYGKYCDLAVRSSVAFFGAEQKNVDCMQESFLNVRGLNDLLEAIKKCYAALFTYGGLIFIIENKIDLKDLTQSIGIQKMVRSDTGSSGIMYTLDSDTGFSRVIHLTSSYGLGKGIVLGTIRPDEFYIFKENIFKKKYKPIISKKLGEKNSKLICDNASSNATKLVPVEIVQRKRYSIEDNEVMTLARWGILLEEFLGKKLGQKFPLQIEWAKDGVTNKLYIIEVKIATIHLNKDYSTIKKYKLTQKGKVLAMGEAIGQNVGEGRCHIIKNREQFQYFRKGQVLVTDMTDPEWEPIMKMASAIVTNRGGRTCHAALVAREYEIPCVVGTKNASQIISQGQNVTINCSEGRAGYVYDGLLDYSVREYDCKHIEKTKTKVMLNVADPSHAFALSFLPNDGVGLIRGEFLINTEIKIHPMVLVNFDKIHDMDLKTYIDEHTFGYTDKKQFFIDKYADGIAKIAAAFHPNPVISRFTDFQSDEYASLIGGQIYEPQENNPMLGIRGAARYHSPIYREAFELECKALKKVRDEMGLTNLLVMIPFCRTVGEAKEVVKIMQKAGLKRGQNGLQIFMMAEVPSNIILADKFAKIFDGFSIGSNDLTQLTLGLDRDSEYVSNIYDERDESVKRMIQILIKTAKKNKKTVSFCGDAASTIPGYTEFLVKLGIDSISLTQDAIINGKLHVLRAEKKKKIFR